MDPAIVINPTLQPDVPYDLFKNLQTVSIVSSSPEVLVVSPHLGRSRPFQELIAYGKANPGKLNFASAGIGTTPHLAGELFKLRTGIEATHIPYKGIGASYTDMMSGKVQMAFSSIAGALPFTTDNRVRAIATTGRASAARSIPTCRPSPRPACRDSRSTSGSASSRPPDCRADVLAQAQRRADKGAGELPSSRPRSPRSASSRAAPARRRREIPARPNSTNGRRSSPTARSKKTDRASSRRRRSDARAQLREGRMTIRAPKDFWSGVMFCGFRRDRHRWPRGAIRWAAPARWGRAISRCCSASCSRASASILIAASVRRRRRAGAALAYPAARHHRDRGVPVRRL